MANTEKLSQFALIALMYKLDAAKPGAPKPGTEGKVPKPKESPTDKASATKKLVDAVQKWLEAYGEPKKSQPKKGQPGMVEAAPEPSETKSEKLQRLRRDLIQRPAMHDSEIGL